MATRRALGTSFRPFRRILAPGLCIVLIVLLAACSDESTGPSHEEVEQMVQAAVEAIPEPEPGLTSADVEEAIRSAMADMPEPESGLSRSEVEEIVNAAIAALAEPQPGLSSAAAEHIARSVVASTPSRTTPAEYTRFFVDNAISFYETHGLDATLAHYNREESVDGQWYVFIIDENDEVIGHPDLQRRGLDLKGWVGTDANGYNYGPEMLSATEEGKWVSYVYQNPENGGLGSGAFELKNVWTVRHDGLLFSSGWYIDADEFTKKLVSLAIESFRSGGLLGTVEYFASPGSALAGLDAAVAYYNTADTVDGAWSAFIADESGNIVAHSNPAMIGRPLEEIFGQARLDVPDGGYWATSETFRVWVERYNGFFFGSGWHQDDSDN